MLRELATGIYIGVAIIIVLAGMWYPAYEAGKHAGRQECQSNALSKSKDAEGK